jgi:hypothetical protein
MSQQGPEIPLPIMRTEKSFSCCEVEFFHLKGKDKMSISIWVIWALLTHSSCLIHVNYYYVHRSALTPCPSQGSEDQMRLLYMKFLVQHWDSQGSQTTAVRADTKKKTGLKGTFSGQVGRWKAWKTWVMRHLQGKIEGKMWRRNEPKYSYRTHVEFIHG